VSSNTSRNLFWWSPIFASSAPLNTAKSTWICFLESSSCDFTLETSSNNSGSARSRKTLSSTLLSVRSTCKSERSFSTCDEMSATDRELPGTDRTLPLDIPIMSGAGGGNPRCKESMSVGEPSRLSGQLSRVSIVLSMRGVPDLLRPPSLRLDSMRSPFLDCCANTIRKVCKDINPVCWVSIA